VVVVGAGDSAVQIAHELAGVAETTLATRAPIRFMPQLVLGRDLHFWLSVSGLDRLPLGRLFDVSEPGGVVDDGTEEPVDAVVLATGYRPNLGYLRPLGVLHEDGRPDQRGGVSRAVAGLYFVGLPFQTSFASATLRGVGSDAELVIARARRHVASSVMEHTSATSDNAVRAKEFAEDSSYELL
jgi:putative flavoprotein involved in K+ transport